MDIDECYQSLANAIVLQAVKDYRKAKKNDCRYLKRDCLSFFRSEWFKDITTINGEALISKLNAEV